MNRSYFYQFICNPLGNRVISKVIPLLPVIMICFQLSPALCADFTGNWSGTWTSYYGGSSGGLSGKITQTGTSLTGTMTVTNTGCGTFPNVPLSGSVSGDVATFQGTVTCSQDSSSNELEFTNGTILGNTITGTYTIKRNSSTWDSGTFILTRPFKPIAPMVDFDGDRKTDIAVYRKSTGAWWIIRSSNGSSYGVGWGGDPSDIPVPGDYDGDGKTDIAIYRKSTGAWWIIPSSTSSPYGVGWGGNANDVPVPGDYDGDGKTDIAVWRPSNAYWYIIRSSDGNITYTPWGALNDVPVSQ